MASNDAGLLQAYAENKPSLFYSFRHLFPEDDCEGSPSRVLMVNSNPTWKKAYETLQAKHGNK